MANERTAFGNQAVPRYTFLGNDGTVPSKTMRRFQYCISASCLALILVGLLLVLSMYLISGSSENTKQNSSLVDTDDFLRLHWPLPEEKYEEETTQNLNDQNRAFQFGVDRLREREFVEDTLPTIPLDSPTFKHQLATYTSEEAQEMSRLGFLINSGSAEMKKRNTLNGTRPRKWRFRPSTNWIPEFCHKKKATKCSFSQYRTMNGTCNNLQYPKWGAALQPFRRILLPHYQDGISEPRLGAHGSRLPSAREVSLSIHRPVYRNDLNFTVMLAVWGQFIDHDMTATALSKGKGSSPISCCHESRKRNQHPECFPVLLNTSDPLYIRNNVSCMEFVRSAPAPVCAFGPREQLNQVTSFLDGSVVYGNSEDVTNQLRTFSGGQLKMLTTDFGELLPVSTHPHDGCNIQEELNRGRYCFLTGDGRANENLLLTSMHLLLAREHNLIAKELREVNTEWTDERLFQETRKIVGAEIQHITYTEFLPAVLPEKLMRYLNLTTKDPGYFSGYNSSINSGIANSFASAAFRFGHTLIPGLLRFLHDNATRDDYVRLHEMLFNPFDLFDRQFLRGVVRGAMNTSMEKADVYFNEELTHRLFSKKKKNPCGLDLVTLNIQRGRDHGLPSYPNWRTVCGLPRPKSFDDLKGDIDEEIVEKMKTLYKDVDDVDLYTGLLAEKPMEGGLMGPTISCLLADQFFRLKVGDRFWYENEHIFTSGQLKEIRKSSLAKIICRTSGVVKAQARVMSRIQDGNDLQNCNTFHYLDVKHWGEA